jgi:hypothetical protein
VQVLQAYAVVGAGEYVGAGLDLPMVAVGDDITETAPTRL